MAPLSDAEKKRRSRARKPAKYHDCEREASRRRMTIYRAKNKAQKRALQLKSLLSEEDAREVEKHVARRKQRILCDWFACRNLNFELNMMNDAKRLTPFMTKVELHKVELQVAEFEISIIENRDVNNGGNTVEFPNESESEGCGGNVAGESSDIDPPNPQTTVAGIHGQGLTNDEIDHLVVNLVKKEMTSSMAVVKNEPEILVFDEGERTHPEDELNLTEETPKIDPSNAELLDGDQGQGPNDDEIDRLKVELRRTVLDGDESSNPGVSVDVSMQAFEDNIDEILAAEKDELLQMNMQDFDVGSGLAIHADCFRPDTFLW